MKFTTVAALFEKAGGKRNGLSALFARFSLSFVPFMQYAG